MVVFCGGLTIEQVEKLKNNDFVIYDKVLPENVHIPNKNTFLYAPVELYNGMQDKLAEYISKDVYENQYVFLATKLPWTFEFCINTSKKNYIMVCDIEENILNKYIGVGRYHGNYRVEYRLPRKYITKDNIIEFLYFEPYDDMQIEDFKKRYYNYFYVDSALENKKADELIKINKLKFNEER